MLELSKCETSLRQRLIDVELDSLEIAAPATDWDREENIQRMRAAMARMDPNIVEILNLRYKEGPKRRLIRELLF